MIDLEAARKLLDFGKRIGEGPRAEQQLRGAVAIHNILQTHRVAYLADEVGMGKTYVALGALALFRHFDPDFRVLIISPRENIQRKWQKEFSNFVANNVRFDDLRVRSLDGRPARPLVSCENLLELVHETSLDPNRDFFARLTSFSLPLGRASSDWKRMRDGLRRQLVWLHDDAFDLRNKESFKKNFARALCCALPKFDLVIVDEAHNLKHGLRKAGAARNQVLAEAFGRSVDSDSPSPRLFPGYGPRAGRVLFLSATPLEETYRHLWNQLDLFGFAGSFDELCRDDVSEERKKEIAGQFLVRRVTSIQVGGREHTKNMYRREWRAGGVQTHDDPIVVRDERQRLIVALIQKKVSEILRGKQFNRSFQIGMLASFESFLETAKLSQEDDTPTFDDTDETVSETERKGIDVRDLNRLAKEYRATFHREMPHPKMDAVVDGLASAWQTGRKALVFVRRVASVTELKRKLDERYDDWLIGRVRSELPAAGRDDFEQIASRYRLEKKKAQGRATDLGQEDAAGSRGGTELEDLGGTDTFFAWFFRGQGPHGVLSGANIQARFIAGSGAYATFFSANDVMDLLETKSGHVLDSLSRCIDKSVHATREMLRERSAKYLSRNAKVVTRPNRVKAAQAAALELLRDHARGEIAERAKVIWEERYGTATAHDPVSDAPAEIASALEQATFFTALRLPENSELRRQIWPLVESFDHSPDGFRKQFRELALRGELLATAARLGHAFIDLYLAAMVGRTTLKLGRDNEASGLSEAEVVEGSEDGSERLARAYLKRLKSQLRSGPDRTWGALDELSEISANFDLILDVNVADARTMPLGEAAKQFAQILRKQQPTAGMAGQVNQTAVRQFRMPGYPFVLVTTDLLQEGEDLHTFCSSIYHYGISWTPSAMEQRIGRIDRVRSQTDRRLASLVGEPRGEDWLQVYFPFLRETVEVLQVERVLDRMNTFLRLMHEGSFPATAEQRRIDVQQEIVAPRPKTGTIKTPLESAFPISDRLVHGSKSNLVVEPDVALGVLERFDRLAERFDGEASIQWESHPPKGSLLGTAVLKSGRIQPFTLLLRSDSGRAVVRCISPIGRTDYDESPDSISRLATRISSRVGAIATSEDRTYDLTVEDDVLLGAPDQDVDRVRLLVHRVTEDADHMEWHHFPDRRDKNLQVFEADLRGEVGHGG